MKTATKYLTLLIFSLMSMTCKKNIVGPSTYVLALIINFAL